MRTIIIVIAVLASLACESLKYTSPVRSGTVALYGYDFREYTKKGFQFTIEPPTGDYESIGVVEIEVVAAIRALSSGQYINSQQSGMVEIDGKAWRVFKEYDGNIAMYYGREVLNTNDAIKELYNRASEMGANAVVNFKVVDSDLNHIRINGFAIKRK